MSLPPLYILRHGQTEWNMQARFQGAANSPLTAQGRAEAAAQGRLLADLLFEQMDIRVSPQGRAFETAAIAFASRVAWLRTDDRLREIDVGAWTGLRRDEIGSVTGPTRPDTPDGFLAVYDHAPDGEGFAALRARCGSFLDDLSRPTICVTHGITSRVLRCLALGLPVAQLGDLPGGQGVVHVVENGAHHTLS